jgi:FkbM family methyltransferase
MSSVRGGVVSVLTIKHYGHRYRIEDPGGIMGKALRTGEPYEAKALHHIYRKNLSGLAVDIGGSVGNHALFFAAICGLRVLTVEPLDHARLQRNVALNPDLDIEVWPVALGDTPGRTTVTGPPSHVAGESFPDDGLVRMERLDDRELTDVALLKIDVEGHEPRVLRGAEETIRRERPVIFAEAESPAAHERNAEILRDFGYSHVKTFGATPLEEWAP